MPYVGYKGDKSAARPPGGSLVVTRNLKATSLPLFLLQSHALDRSPEQAPGSSPPKTCLQNYHTDSLPKQKHSCYLYSFNLHVMSQSGRYPSVKNKLKRSKDLGLCDRCAKPGHPTEQYKSAKEAFKGVFFLKFAVRNQIIGLFILIKILLQTFV